MHQHTASFAAVVLNSIAQRIAKSVALMKFEKCISPLPPYFACLSSFISIIRYPGDALIFGNILLTYKTAPLRSLHVARIPNYQLNYFEIKQTRCVEDSNTCAIVLELKIEKLTKWKNNIIFLDPQTDYLLRVKRKISKTK